MFLSTSLTDICITRASVDTRPVDTHCELFTLPANTSQLKPGSSATVAPRPYVAPALSISALVSFCSPFDCLNVRRCGIQWLLFPLLSLEMASVDCEKMLLLLLVKEQ